jgi:undecaprenyl-diphosphatase
MDYLQSIVLGLIQGLTEWLPISSSGHLVLAQRLMNLTVPVGFDVMLHLGTLLSVVIFFWRDIKKILVSVFNRDVRDENFKLFTYILIGSVPTAVIGFFLMKFFESLFLNIRAVGVGFLVTGLLLLLSRFWNNNKKLSWKSSLLIGTVQGVSIAPGISRSGSTISTGLFSGVKREDVFKYSFLLSIPAIIGATIMEYGSADMNDLCTCSAAGLVVAAFVGYFAIKAVKKILISDKFYWFAAYCFVLGAVVLAVL